MPQLPPGSLLGPNKSKAVSLKINSFPTSLPTGPYYIVAQVIDAAGNSAIAASASTISVAPAFVDLTGTLPPVPPVLKAGKRTSLQLTVNNDGNVAAAGSLHVQLLARPTGTAGGADVLLGTSAVRVKLVAGASRRLRLPFTLPQNLSPATSYTLVAVL